MIAFHRTITTAALSAFLAGLAVGEATAQPTASPKPETTAGLAAEMAKTKAKEERWPPHTSYTSQGDTVEIRTKVEGAIFFARIKADADQERVRAAAAACSDSRWANYLKRGVIMHHTVEAFNGSDSFEYTVAQSLSEIISFSCKAFGA